MTIFLNEYIHPEARKLLESHCAVVDTLDVPEKIDGIILRTFEVNAEIMDQCKNLKVIGKHGVGCNTIDLEEAKRRGITVLNTPAANTNAVAELIVALILDIARNVTTAHKKTQAGAFAKIAPAQMTGMEISGKTLGLIGTGNIARRVAEILRGGFGMRVIGYDPFVGRDAMAKMGYEKYETVQDLIAASDVVNVSVPLTPATRDLIAGETFDCFRKSAILVNAARGGIVNEEDLYHALKAGKLRAAACDAFVSEPPTRENTNLYELENFIGTPHIGACTEEALHRMLICEGLYYTLLALLASLLLTVCLGPVIGNGLTGVFWFFSYRLTVTPILLILPVFLLLGTLVPLWTYRAVAKRTIVERLREAES